MDLSDIRTMLKDLPAMRSTQERPGSAASADLLATAEVISVVLRKTGVQRLRTDQELLEMVKSSTDDSAKLHNLIAETRQRAAQAERVSDGLAKVVVSALDFLHRLGELMDQDPALGGWAQQVRAGAARTVGDASKIGLTTLGAEGEPFDPEVHDNSAPMTQTRGQQLVVTKVRSRGYLWRAKVLRRAVVDVAPK